MEDVLDIYKQPYDPMHPKICFDERPCQLIGDILVPISMKPGKPRKQNYEYQRNGTCCVLLAFEPDTGFRYVEIQKRRTALDYAQFFKNLVEKHYPNVMKIRLVQDNLNTHHQGSFYQIMSPQDAFNFAQKFELHYTPKNGSWLNMAEIEFSALARQCLDRRIGDFDTLRDEVLVWTQKRNRLQKTVNWKFSKKDARKKFQNKYPLHVNQN